MFVDESMYFKIPLEISYGDLIWWANPGTMILPDFFHRKNESVRGMHGYDPFHSHSQGSCIVFGGAQARTVTPQLPLTAVNDLLKQSIRDQTGIHI